MDVKCPGCGQTLQNDRSLAGQQVQCPFCNNAFDMPIFDMPKQRAEKTDKATARHIEKLQTRVTILAGLLCVVAAIALFACGLSGYHEILRRRFVQELKDLDKDLREDAADFQKQLNAQ